MAKPTHLAEVLATERLSASLVRIVLGGEGLRDFRAGEHTDHYVKVQLPPPAAPYAPPFDIKRVKAELPREAWPRVRSITVRAWDPKGRRLTLDFVDHGPGGYAGPWAVQAKPGDLLQLAGPGGSYSPDPDADWHILVGDLAALPAIAASLERIVDGVPTYALIEIENPEDRLELRCRGSLDLRWIAPRSMLAAVETLDLPAGRGQAFVHGEAEMVRAVRRHLIVERGLDRKAMSASGYWKRDRTDEAWRAEKKEWKRRAEADLQVSKPT